MYFPLQFHTLMSYILFHTISYYFILFQSIHTISILYPTFHTLTSVGQKKSFSVCEEMLPLIRPVLKSFAIVRIFYLQHQICKFH